MIYENKKMLIIPMKEYEDLKKQIEIQNEAIQSKYVVEVPFHYSLTGLKGFYKGDEKWLIEHYEKELISLNNVLKEEKEKNKSLFKKIFR